MQQRSALVGGWRYHPALLADLGHTADKVGASGQDLEFVRPRLWTTEHRKLLEGLQIALYIEVGGKDRVRGNEKKRKKIVARNMRSLERAPGGDGL